MKTDCLLYCIECGHALQPVNNVGCNAYKNIDNDEHPKEFMMGQFLNEIRCLE